MNSDRQRQKIRSALKWILWVLLAQFLLINISGIFYGYKLTYFYEASQKPAARSKNIFVKTWKLFTGPRFHKSSIEEVPHFSYETIHLPAGDSRVNIEGWYMPVDSAKGTVILIHGLGGNKSMLLKQAYEFRYFGFNVMLIDLRAHGNSGGHVTKLGYAESEDVKLAYDYLSKKGEKNIILYGISLGATVIVKAVYDYNLSPSRIILEIPFESQEKLFAKRGKFLGFPEEPFGMLVTFWASIERGFNAFNQHTSRYAEKVQCPVLLLCAARDKIVSPAETDAIFRHIASREKKIVEFENMQHEIILNKDTQEWRRQIALFILK